MDKEQFLAELENQFDDISWEEILSLTNRCMQLDDSKIKEMISEIHRLNRISFQQWKYLRWFLSKNEPKTKKYKYGK